MSEGLPAHLAPNAVRRSFVASQHAVAFTLLVIAALMTLAFQPTQTTPNLWLSMVALFPTLGLLLITDRFPILVWSALYLLVGGLGTYLFALGMLSPTIPMRFSDGFVLLLVKIALIMVGGVILGVRMGIAAALLGYVIAEAAVGFALVRVGVPFRFDAPALIILLATITTIWVLSMNTSEQRWAFARLQRAARDEHLANLRYRIEAKSASLMHDTVLNHLAAIAHSDSEEIADSLREAIKQDVQSLMGGEWIAQSVDSVEKTQRGSWPQSRLFDVIQDCRRLGLDIAISGDIVEVRRLDRDVASALGLAVKQCLVNVLEHSGVREADVAIYCSDSELSVMVIDSGSGFLESATGDDRLGLRSSVRERIELVGGTVTVWSTPGRGTSIMITVPTSGKSTGVADGPLDGPK